MLVVILMTFSVVKIGKKYENENVNDNFFINGTQRHEVY